MTAYDILDLAVIFTQALFEKACDYTVMTF